MRGRDEVQSVGWTRLMTIPADDVVLRHYAGRAAAGAQQVSAVEQRLRPLFPDVVVRRQHELASIQPDTACYVYRDRLYHRWGLSDDARRGTAGGLTFDDIGRFVEADASVDALFGVSQEGLVGASGRSFFAPGFEDWYDDLIDLVRQHPSLSSGWHVHRPDGSTRYAEFEVVRDGAGPGRHRALFRPFQRGAARGWFGAGSRLEPAVSA
jgi:PAS domain S-box-containing protein